jgi:membrane protein YdbS with pleckstrin-like domain
MRYADTLLTQGEVVVMRQRQHWLALFLDARTAVALWLVGALLLLSVVLFNVNDRAIRDIISFIGLGAIALGVAIFLYHLWRWWSQDYMVTNRRILKVEGILNKRAADSSLEKINDAVLDQNVVGRMFNYGDLDILTAADSAIDRYRMLNQAPKFKREMLQQKYALETEFAYQAPPTPPLRPDQPAPRQAPEQPVRRPDPEPVTSASVAASEWQQVPSAPTVPATPVQTWPEAPAAAGPVGATIEGDTDAGSVAMEREPSRAPDIAAAAAPPSPGPARMSDDDAATAVTQTLSRLADLRDRGAITPEEYEAKKTELLGRL